MIDEFALIERIRQRIARRDVALEVGPGDDAAAVRLGGGRRMLLTTDALVAGVHFDPARESARDVGWRAVAANVSDIAAMGGRPRWLLLSMALPEDTAVEWVEDLVEGFAEAADAVGAVVAGGNLTRARDLALHVALVGETEWAPLRRCGARPGDRLFLSGPVGAAAAGRCVAAGGPGAYERDRLRRRYLRPPFRLDAAAVLAQVASAAIDVSDGLLQDLGHLADASGVGVRLRLDAVPLAFGHPRDDRARALELALGGGEDYEILAAVPVASIPLAGRLCAEAGVGLYEIGEAADDLPAGTLVGIEADGAERLLARRGFRHFDGRGR